MFWVYSVVRSAGGGMNAQVEALERATRRWVGSEETGRVDNMGFGGYGWGDAPRDALRSSGRTAAFPRGATTVIFRTILNPYVVCYVTADTGTYAACLCLSPRLGACLGNPIFESGKQVGQHLGCCSRHILERHLTEQRQTKGGGGAYSTVLSLLYSVSSLYIAQRNAQYPHRTSFVFIFVIHHFNFLVQLFYRRSSLSTPV